MKEKYNKIINEEESLLQNIKRPVFSANVDGYQ